MPLFPSLSVTIPKAFGTGGPLHNQPLTATRAVGGFLFAQQFAQHFGFYFLRFVTHL